MLTIEEVAQELKVTKKTVYRWIHEGRIKAIRIGGVFRVEEGEFNRLTGKGGKHGTAQLYH